MPSDYEVGYEHSDYQATTSKPSSYEE